MSIYFPCVLLHGASLLHHLWSPDWFDLSDTERWGCADSGNLAAWWANVHQWAERRGRDGISSSSSSSSSNFFSRASSLSSMSWMFRKGMLTGTGEERSWPWGGAWRKGSGNATAATLMGMSSKRMRRAALAERPGTKLGVAVGWTGTGDGLGGSVCIKGWGMWKLCMLLKWISF